MARDCAFVCQLASGFHARPASALEQATRRFAAELTLHNERTGALANAKSVLGIVGLDIRHGDGCRIVCEGPDEYEAAEALTRFVTDELLRADAAMPPVPSSAALPLPRLLEQAHATVLRGSPVVRGIGHGGAMRVHGFVIPEPLVSARTDDPHAEWERLQDALRALDAQYEAELAVDGTGVAAEVLRAHQAIARDPALAEHLQRSVRQHQLGAAGAIVAAEANFAAMLAASESAPLRERALDVRDVCRQLFEAMYGANHASAPRPLTCDTVCIAENLTPREFLSLDRRFLQGLVLEHAAATSHTIVLARSFGVPTLSGVAGLRATVSDGDDVTVDADLGVLVTRGNAATRRYYAMERARIAGRRERLLRAAAKPAATSDGRIVEIGVNVATGAEAAAAVSAGADGIGLFRTELLFMHRGDAPSEDEQFEDYRRALAGAAGKPVIIRTLDIGGDKPIAYLRLPREENPFLGFRAVRMYARFEDVVRTQLRALVRASAFGNLKVMVPMVSRLDEAEYVRRLISEEQARCAAAGVAFDASMQVGAMVEVPSMAYQMAQFSRVFDFFSIGTNDLLQYFSAVDRGNQTVAHLHDPLSPAFLQLLRQIVDGAHAAGRWVGMCGELAGDAQALPLLVGLGLDELSMAASRVAETKAAVQSLGAAQCRALVATAIECATSRDVAAAVESFDGWRPVPLITPDLVVVDADCDSREEAIKAVVDRLYVTGRTDHPRDVEAAVWQREAVYSTAFGHGFAIPHCQSDALKANSLVILRTRQPVAWESLDGQPVSVLLLLAIRSAEHATAHLKILASLSRKLMHASTREQVLCEQDPAALCRYLMECVGE